MKLTSNILFGKYCKSKEKEFKTRLEYLDWYEKTRNNFDEFLEQPLKLEMFVPCDNDEEILKPQYIAGKEVIYNELVEEFIMDKVKEYNDAKEKVLFEGFYIKRGSTDVDNMTTYLMHNYFGEIAFKKDWKDEWEFIEDLESLSNLNEIELTESAIKQIGL